MAEPENRTLRLIRELRDDIKSLDKKLDTEVDGLATKIGALDQKIDRNHEDVKRRLDSLRKAMVGENILGLYATAEFEERPAAVEERLSAIEDRR